MRSTMPQVQRIIQRVAFKLPMAQQAVAHIKVLIRVIAAGHGFDGGRVQVHRVNSKVVDRSKEGPVQAMVMIEKAGPWMWVDKKQVGVKR